ncbi:MAG: PD-(D/E)XK nuclease family protein [Candidatus Woykebacteria bacterium]
MIKLSRSKLELLIECPKCFWLYAGKNISRPFGAPYTINNAIDFLLKKEFDDHRKGGTAHYLIEREGIEAIPYLHDDIDKWRNTFTGIQYEDHENGFLVFGAVDDIWVDSKGNLIVVDYKASGAKEGELYESYKRQVEIYQWLLRKNKFKVLDRAYFVYARVNKDNGFADGKLDFNIKVQPYEGDASWVESKIKEAKKILSGPIPKSSDSCIYCTYRTNANKLDSS